MFLGSNSCPNAYLMVGRQSPEGSAHRAGAALPLLPLVAGGARHMPLRSRPGTAPPWRSSAFLQHFRHPHSPHSPRTRTCVHPLYPCTAGRAGRRVQCLQRPSGEDASSSEALEFQPSPTCSCLCDFTCLKYVSSSLIQDLKIEPTSKGCEN